MICSRFAICSFCNFNEKQFQISTLKVEIVNVLASSPNKRSETHHLSQKPDPGTKHLGAGVRLRRAGEGEGVRARPAGKALVERFFEAL